MGKRRVGIAARAWVLCCGAGCVVAQPTIDPVDRYAWGANVGWTNWRHDTGSPGAGATIGQYYCSGEVWGANVGWITLGDGAPADGVQYSNTGSDYGINHDGQGNLSGFAWGQNIGWINFEQTHGMPRIDLVTGQFSGYAWSANCGWISLANGAQAAVETNTIEPGADTDGDTLADAWELEKAAAAGQGAGLSLLSDTTDTDGDGKSDLAEYLADSDPFDFADFPKIVQMGRDEVTSELFIEWTSSPRRLYEIGSKTDLNDAFTVAFDNIAPGPGPTTTVMFADPPLESKFWRVGAKLPLAP